MSIWKWLVETSVPLTRDSGTLALDIVTWYLTWVMQIVQSTLENVGLIEEVIAVLAVWIVVPLMVGSIIYYCFRLGDGKEDE